MSSLFRRPVPARAALLAVLLLLGACNAPQTPPATSASAPPTPTAAPPAPANAPAPADNLVEGRDYAAIKDGQPFEAEPGKIELVEVFGYTCPHCAHFEPQLEAWIAKQPADVKLVPVAAPFGSYWMPYARAFYTAQAMGVQEKSHAAMFKAVHETHSLPVQPLPTNEQLAGFYKAYGADPAQFASMLSSFPVEARMKQASEFIDRSGVDSTPTLVVDGRYRVTGATFDDQLRIAGQLIERVRRERAAH